MKDRLIALVVAGFGLLVVNTSSGSEPGAYTPPPGSAPRRAIMDTLRLDFYRHDSAGAHRNPQGVFYRVSYLKVHADWALVCATPVNAAGEEMADLRWTLLHRQTGQWTDADYFDAVSPASQDESLDVLSLSAATIRKVWRKFPDAPRDIFPALDTRPR